MVAFVTALAAILPTPSGEAHTLVFGTSVTTSLCVGAGLTGSVNLYNNTGPVDVTQAVRVSIGLESGDTTQFAWYNFSVLDNGTSAEIARSRGALSNWVQSSNYTEGATLSFHIGTSFDLDLDVHNIDSASQCFQVFARNAWVGNW